MAITPEPVYLMLGDSIFNGEITTDIIADLKSARLGSGRSAIQKVWNRQTSNRETYNPATNGNRSGTLVTLAGPEISITAELALDHPTGFTLVKRACFSSAMATPNLSYVVISDSAVGGTWAPTTSSQNWDEFVTDVDDAMADIAADGSYPDVLGVFVCLGDNDAFSSPSAFESGLSAFITAIRSTFTTRTTGDPLPIVWRLPQRSTSLGTDANRGIVRAALTAQARRDSRLRLVDVDDLERSSSDNIHENPLSSIESGRRLAVAMRRMVR